MSLSKRDRANLSEAIASALIPVLEQLEVSKPEASKPEPTCSNHMAAWSSNELNALRANFKSFICQQANSHGRTNLSIVHKLRNILSEPF